MTKLAMLPWLLPSASVYGLVHGGRPERIAALALLATCVSRVGLATGWTSRHLDPWFGCLGIELALLVVLVSLALTANRYWPIWLCALQIMITAPHLVPPPYPFPAFHAYQPHSTLWGVSMALTLACATWRHRGRLRRWGNDPA